jgi:hypothetical protein
MADGKKVAGVARAGSHGHDFPKRKHWEREGAKANSPRGKALLERVANMEADDGAMASSSELEGNCPRSHQTMRKRDGEEEEKEASSLESTMTVAK